MAFYNEKDEDEQNPDTASSSVAPSGGSAFVQGGAGQADSAGSAPANQPGTPDSPGSFVGIKQYLDQNKNQAEKLAKNVGSFVEQQGAAAQNALSQGAQQFNQAADQNTVNLNQDLLNRARTDSASVAANQQELADFQKMRDANYGGPQSFEQSEYYQPAKQAVDKALQAAKNTQSVEGRNSLLTGIQNQNQNKASRGAATLDNAILGTSSDSKRILQEARDKVNPIQQNLTQVQQDALAKANQAKANTEATRNAVLSVFDGDQGVQKQLEADLQSRAAAARNQSLTQARQTEEALKANAQLNDEQLGILGLSREDYNALLADRDLLKSEFGKTNYDDLTQFATMQSPDALINAQNIASADDYARYAALNQLMGTQNQFLSDPSQAGKANLDAYDFDAAAAKSNIQQSMQLERQAKAQREAEEAAARARAEAEEAARREQQRLEDIAKAALMPAIPVYREVFCFVEGTPILMEDRTYRAVETLVIGDEVAYGGLVIGHGVNLCMQIVKYKGKMTSSQHAIFDGTEFKRAIDLEGIEIIDLDVPTRVFPVVTQNHLLVSNNGIVYADLVEADAPGASDAEKLELLNEEENVKAMKALADVLKEELKWPSVSTEQMSTTLN